MSLRGYHITLIQEILCVSVRNIIIIIITSRMCIIKRASRKINTFRPRINFTNCWFYCYTIPCKTHSIINCAQLNRTRFEERGYYTRVEYSIRFRGMWKSSNDMNGVASGHRWLYIVYLHSITGTIIRRAVKFRRFKRTIICILIHSQFTRPNEWGSCIIIIIIIF